MSSAFAYFKPPPTITTTMNVETQQPPLKRNRKHIQYLIFNIEAYTLYKIKTTFIRHHSIGFMFLINGFRSCIFSYDYPMLKSISTVLPIATPKYQQCLVVCSLLNEMKRENITQYKFVYIFNSSRCRICYVLCFQIRILCAL